jgi:hypothetical protein
VFSLDNRTRVVLGALAFVLGFVWLGSDFSESSARERKRAAAAPASRSSSASKPAGEPATAGRRVAAPSRAEDIGRTAGRLAGKGVNIYREQAAKRRKP